MSFRNFWKKNERNKFDEEEEDERKIYYDIF